MKPSSPKNRFDGFTTDTVTCLFCNSGFTSDTDQFHHRHQQFHHRNRVLNFAGTGDAPKGDGISPMKLLSGTARDLLVHLDANAHTLGWTARDLFGLHPVPDQVAANYSRLSRRDAMASPATVSPALPASRHHQLPTTQQADAGTARRMGVNS
jgi:hypothetical protein